VNTPTPTKPTIAGGDRPPPRSVCWKGEGGGNDVDDDDVGEGELVGSISISVLLAGPRASSGYCVGKREDEDMADAFWHWHVVVRLWTLCAQCARE
jgi:hypothetical protein